MRNIYKIIFLLLLSIFVLSCGKETKADELEFIGADKISRLELSINSPVLDADGKAKLSFQIKGFYKYKDKEYPMLTERMPWDKIEIFASTGEKINAKSTFSTKNTGEIEFYCKLNENESKRVSVKAIAPVDEHYTPVVIPVQIYVLYDETIANRAENINKENFEKLFDRVNKVFAGKLADAPSSCDSKVSFKVEKITKIKDEVDYYDLTDYIKDNMMKGTDKHFTIWVAESIPWGIAKSNCSPQYTFGNPDDLPGLDLQTITDVSEISGNSAITSRGLTMSYYDFYNVLNSNLNTEIKFERMIGKAFGLLNTSYYDVGKDQTYLDTGDLDYCEDTFTYEDKFPVLEKSVFLSKEEKEKGVQTNYYDSFNVMDQYSTATTITRDQIKRIRQVIKNCPPYNNL